MQFLKAVGVFLIGAGVTYLLLFLGGTTPSSPALFVGGVVSLAICLITLSV